MSGDRSVSDICIAYQTEAHRGIWNETIYPGRGDIQCTQRARKWTELRRRSVLHWDTFAEYPLREGVFLYSDGEAQYLAPCSMKACGEDAQRASMTSFVKTRKRDGQLSSMLAMASI